MVTTREDAHVERDASWLILSHEEFLPPPRRRFPLALAVLGPLVVALTALSAGPAAAAYASLQAGADAMERGRQHLAVGAVTVAEESFARATDEFDDASQRLATPQWRVAAVVPYLGRAVEAAHSLADSSVLAARAGVVMARGLQHAQSAAAGADGVPIAALVALRPAVAEAAALTGAAQQRAAQAPDGLIGPVKDAQQRLEAALAEAARAFESASTLSEALPAFLGADGPQRYFFGAQNPAELRGTGGLLGSYSILTVTEGRLSFEEFSPIYALADAEVSAIPAPNPSYATRYNHFGGAGFWRNTNMTPDFPSAAQAVHELYAHVSGERLAGVVYADPRLLEGLMGLTGPVTLPEYGRVDGERMVDLVTNESYDEFEGQNPERDAFFGRAAGQVLAEFFDGPIKDDPVAAARVFVDAVSDGHLMLWSADPAIQRALDTAGASARIAAPDGDYLNVVGNNAAGNKIDYYAQRRVDYEVVLGPAARGTGRAAVELHNDAPSTGMPPAVIGPTTAAGAGENITWFSVFCGPTCRLTDATLDDAPVPATQQVELGHPVFSSVVHAHSGQRRRLEYEWDIAEAWTGDGNAGTYRLTVQNQATLRPTEMRVVVRVPPGATITEVSDGMTVVGGAAVWEGRAPSTRKFEVRFVQDRRLLARD